MELGKISLGSIKSIQRTQEQKTLNNSNKLTTNPFGVSFKGNVIQADVFESAKKAASNVGIAERGKLFASAVISGINSFNEAFKSRINSIISFGKKVTTDFFNTIERIGNTEISLDMSGIANRLFPDRQYSVKNLAAKPVAELKTMWQGLAKAV